MIKYLKMFILTLIFSGCASINPLIQNFNIISVAQEQQMAVEMSGQIAKEMAVLPASAQTRRVQSIGSELLKVLPQKDFNYEFNVVDAEDPNAFTIPGGKIYVHSGLLDFVDSDDELAGVIAHEIGHAYERHSTKSLSRAYGVDYLSQLLFNPKDGTGAKSNGLGSIAMQIAKGGVLTNYSRRDEFEADEIGFYLMKKSKFSEEGLLRFLQKLNQLSPGSPVSILSTHPPTPDRVARLQELIRGAEPQIDFSAPAELR